MKSRLFLKFLLVLLGTSIAVVILMVVTMQFFVYRHFSDYVLQQELSSLEGLSETFSQVYQKENNWNRFRNNPRNWHDFISRFFPANPSHPGHPPPPGDMDRPEAGQKPNQDGRGRRKPPIPHPRGPAVSDMARRLSLFDDDKQLVIGNPVLSEQALRPIYANDQVVGWLGLKKMNAMTRPTDIRFLTRQAQAFYVIGAVVLLLAAAISFFFSRHMVSPIKQIAHGARAIRNKRFDTRIPVASRDELGQLAEDFNIMAHTLQRHERIRRQWLIDIAHELRTPLAVLRGEIEALQDGIREITPKSMASLHAETMYLSKIVDDLSLIARTENDIMEMKSAPLNPVQVLRETLQRYRSRFDAHQIALREDFQDADRLTIGDADKLSRVFTNIFENTLRYAERPGRFTVGAAGTEDQIILFMEDAGPGVPEADLNRLFDRLYRTDSARTRESGGSGLGLSICKSIIDAHGGTIHAENGSSGGLKIVVHLPAQHA